MTVYQEWRDLTEVLMHPLHCGLTDDPAVCACGCSGYGDWCGCSECQRTHWTTIEW